MAPSFSHAFNIIHVISLAHAPSYTVRSTIVLHRHDAEITLSNPESIQATLKVTVGAGSEFVVAAC